MAEQLIKRWDRFDGGIGILVDDERNPGAYYAENMIGTQTEIRPAPASTAVDINSYLGGTATDLRAIRWFEEDKLDGTAYLYCVVVRDTTTVTNTVIKVDLRNATFGADIESKALQTGGLEPASSPVRYQGLWRISGNDASPIQTLTTINTPPTPDVWTNGAANTGAHELVLTNFQIAAAKGGSGARVLAVNGDPAVAADWGSYFSAGDKEDNPQAMFTFENAIFVLKSNGLFTFRVSGGLSGTILGSSVGSFVDPNNTRRQVAYWAGGVVFPTPGGLMYYRPGGSPHLIGLEARLSHATSPLAGPSKIIGGRYLAVASINELLYTVYQPNTDSAAALLLVGISSDPESLALSWHVLRSYNLSAVDAHGRYREREIFVSRAGRPTNAKIERPTLWYDSATTDLNYIVLGQNGYPLRDRSESHVIATAGDYYLSELRFEVPHNITRLVVYTADFASGDELQLQAIDQAGTEINVGAPITGSANRHERIVNIRDVQRFMLHLNWVATSTASRTPPAITRLELWGMPAGG